MTNWEYYFGTPERAALTEVRFHVWPFMIIVNRIERINGMPVTRLVSRFDSDDEYAAWLKAERDDGIIEWEGEA